MNEHWLTVAEAAQRAGVTPGRIRTLLQEAALYGRKFGPVWQVDEVSLNRWIATKRTGRPRKQEEE